MDAAGLELRKPHSIVFVHGTFAGRLSDRGSVWWQLGSKFSQLVRRALEGLAIPSEEAFHWTGENSDVFRVFDSALLLKRLRRENEKGPFQVVAHSHGGMVLWHALMLAVEQQIPLDNLRSWMTVGTPFIFYEARIGRIARHHLVPTLIALIFSCLLVFHRYKSWIAAWLFAFGILVIFLTYLLYLAKSSSKRLRSLEKETMRQFGPLWLGVRSKHDEAIALLKTAVLLRTPVTPVWNDCPQWSYSQAGATDVPGRIPQRVWSRRGPSNEDPAFLVQPSEWLRKTKVSGSGWRMHALKWMLHNMFFWPLEVCFALVRFGYNEFLVDFLNSAAASVARSYLLGDDAPYFVAVSVTDVPSRDQGLSTAELPREVDEALVQQADANAKGLLADLRRNYISQLVLMHSASILAAPPSTSSDLTGALVHCLYFEVESCQKLIAAALRHVCGLDVSRAHEEWTKQAHTATLKMTETR